MSKLIKENDFITELVRHPYHVSISLFPWFDKT